MATTSPDSIYYPVSTDFVAPLETVFSALATSVQTALATRAVYNYRWANDAARTAQTGMRNGDIGFQSDTQFTYKRISGVWYIWDTPILSYTPTLTGITLGNGVRTGSYAICAGHATIGVLISWGSTSSFTGSPVISLPFAPATNILMTSDAEAYEGSGNFGRFKASAILSGGAITLRPQRTIGTTPLYVLSLPSTAFTNSIPFTWSSVAQLGFTVSFPINITSI